MGAREPGAVAAALVLSASLLSTSLTTGCSPAGAVHAGDGGTGPTIMGPSLGFGDDSGAVDAEGDATSPQLSADIIPFDLVPCGSSTSQTLDVYNVGTETLTVAASVSGIWFSVSPSMVTIPANGEGMLNVTVTIPQTAAAGVTLNGSLNLTTNDPAQPSLQVPLTVVPQGATIAMQSGAATVAFPESEVGHPADSQQFSLVNSGNASATVTIAATTNSAFTLGGTDAGVTLNGGESSFWTVAFTAPTAAAASATSAVTVSGTTCGTSLGAVSFSAQGGYGSLSGWPTAPVDFGPAPCGGAPPSGQSFQLTNNSDVDVHVTAVSINPADAGFEAGARIGDVLPADTTRVYEVNLTAPAAPSQAALTPITATLTIQTDGDSPHTVTLEEEPQGAVLAFDTSASSSFGSFGPVLLLTSASQSFSVTNKGNAAANVQLRTGSSSLGDAGADGSADADGAPGTFAVSTPSFSIAANGTQTDSVTFTPGTGATYSDAITLSAVGPLCSPPPSGLPLSGVGIAGGPKVYPTSLSFLATCGAPAPSQQSVILVNTGVADMSWSVSAVTGPGVAQYTFAAAGTRGTLAPSETAVFGIGAAAIASPAPVTDPAALSAQFTITTDVPLDQPHVISLSEVPLGDQLSFSVQELRFGQFPIDYMTPQQAFAVTNSANSGSPPASFSLELTGTGANVYVEPEDGGAVCVVPLEGSLDGPGLCPVPEAGPADAGDAGDATTDAHAASNATDGSAEAAGPEAVVAGYLLVPGGPMALAPGGVVSPSQIVTFIPTAAASYPASIAIQTQDPLCAALPAPLSLTGTGTQGQVSLSATTLAFGTDPADPAGLVNCGSTGLAHALTVANTGNSSFDVTGIALGKGSASPYAISGITLPATISIGGSVSLTVTPSAIPASVAEPNDPSPFVDTLTITTDAAFDVPHTVSLAMQARGAVIANRPLGTSWSFGTIGAGSIGTLVNAIQNVGNAPAWVSLQGLSLPSVFGLEANPTAVVANGTTAFVGQFEPPAANGSWSDQGTLVVTPAQVFCQPVPAAWTSPTIGLAGASNAAPPITLSGSLAFPASQCGSAPPGGQSVTITNNTNQPYGYSLAFTTGAFYTITDPGAGVVAASGSTTVVVTPSAVTPGPAVEPGAAPYADTLLITTVPGGPGDAAGAVDGAVGDSGVSEAPSFTVPISWTLGGAVLSLPQGAGPRTDAQGAAFYPADTTSGFTLPLANGGTEAATVSLAIQPAEAFTFATSGAASVPSGSSAAPQLSATTSDATCPATTRATATFVYSGPVCQPLPFAQIVVEACQGTLQ